MRPRRPRIWPTNTSCWPRRFGPVGSARDGNALPERRRQAQAVAEELLLGDVVGGLLGDEDPQRTVALQPGDGRIGAAVVARAVGIQLGVPAADVQLVAPPLVRG